jgi:hypothetical protein
MSGLSDEEIVKLFNDTLQAQTQLAASSTHVAVEVPLGSPHIRCFVPGDQWTLRGGVLRCLIEDSDEGRLGGGDR